MFKKLRLSLAAISLCLSSAHAIAEDNCSPDILAKRIDAFSNEPYGVAAWRTLQGLGVPEIELSSVDYNNWQSVDNWRKKVSELTPELQGVQDVGYDCRMSYPLQILMDRAQNVGTASPYLKQWVMAQGVVIAACSNTENAPKELPPALIGLPAPIDALQVEDRAYQTASIAFYKDKPTALVLFKQVAQSQSTHRAHAHYNIANLLANIKNMGGARTEAKAILADPSLKSVHAITQELLGYISNIEDTPEGWAELIDHTTDVLSKPKAEIMASAALKSDYARALNDINYAGIAAKQDDWWVRGQLPENATLSKAIMDEARKSPMALWMMTGQSVNEAYQGTSWAMVGDQWNAWSTSYVDRALALKPAGAGISAPAKELLDLLKSKPDDETRITLWTKTRAAMSAVSKSCGTAPETAAAAQLLLHAVGLSAMAGKFDEALDGLAAVPFKGADYYSNGVVYKLAQYFLSTGNVEQGRRLRDRILTPEFFNAASVDQQEQLKRTYSDFLGWVAEDESHWRDALHQSSQKLGAPLLNLLPTKSLVELAKDTRFSDNQKSLLLRAAWTRNYAQGKKIDHKLTDEMLAANPQIKATFDEIAQSAPKLSLDKRWLLTILRNPRFGILVNSNDSFNTALETPNPIFAALDEYDHNDKNWWCPLEPGRQLNALRLQYSYAAGAHDPSPRDLAAWYDPALAIQMSKSRESLLKQHPVVKTLDAAEIASLEHSASAPNKLSYGAIAWGKASNGDDGAPEALALAVKATRYGCNWHGGHKAYSKPAQELLKTKFVGTQWAESTPYWFNCQEMIYDKDYNKVASCKPHTWPADVLPK